MTKVIAITGCMGSGKTTLAEHLHRLIPGTTVLFEDDFQTMTQMNLLELEQWRIWWRSLNSCDLVLI
jgi:uridine kinase